MHVLDLLVWFISSLCKRSVLQLWVLFPQFENQKLTVLEAGCGVGNCLFPLLEDLNIFAYACDFSPRAVEYVQVGAPSMYSLMFLVF